MPGWLSAIAFLGVVALYWYSVGLGGYRFPVLPAAGLLVAAFGLLAWWCVRAAATAERDRDEWVKSPVVKRHRCMLLGIAYAGASALLAMAAGVAGDDRSWHRFTDAEPQVAPATATLLTEVDEYRSTWTASVQGFAEADGETFPFRGERVEFADDPLAGDPAELELWAVFDPAALDAGLVVADDRDSAEAVLDRPFVPLLPFGLVVIAIAWAVQLFTFRPGLYGKWSAVPIGPVPWQIWVMTAVGGALYGFPFAWFAGHAGGEGPYSAAHRTAFESGGSIWAGGLLLTAVSVLAMVFYHAGMNSWAEYGRRVERDRPDRPAGSGEPRATGGERKAKRGKDRRRRKRKRRSRGR